MAENDNPVRHRGLFKVDWVFTFACAAYNLVIEGRKCLHLRTRRAQVAVNELS
jgi:hypothetical protein